MFWVHDSVLITGITAITETEIPTLWNEKKGGFRCGEATPRNAPGTSLYGVQGHAPPPGKILQYRPPKCHFLHFEKLGISNECKS